MPDVRWPRLMLSLLLLAAGAVRAGDATLVVVAPDVEIVVGAEGDTTILPSAAAADAFAAAWATAVAAAVGATTPAAAWAPPATLDDDDALAQALVLQDAVADAVLARGTRSPRRPRSLGAGGRVVAAATGATHALFARVRTVGGRQESIAMVVDLRDGAVVDHEIVRGSARADPAGVAARLARVLRPREGAPLRFALVAPDPAPALPSDDLERAVARSVRALHRNPARVDAPGLVAYLTGVACRVAADRCATARLHVLRDAGAQAATLPGGTVVLRTGLLLRLRDEAELAFVLAHELAHERRADGLERWADGRRSAAGAEREREAAADADAFAALVAAGYDPGAATRLWRRLIAEQRGGRPATIVGTHPELAERLAALVRTAPTASETAGHQTGAERWSAQVAPFRRAWLAEEVMYGDREATRAMLEAALADAAPDARADLAFALDELHGRRDDPLAPPAADPAGAVDAADTPAPTDATLRVLGMRLPTALPWLRQPGIGVETWTIDGPSLNRLLVVAQVKVGEPLLRDAAPRAPPWRAGLRGDEIRDLVLKALHSANWRNLSASGLRPHDFAGVPGWRAELTLAAASGLRYRGTMAFAVRDGRLDVLLWFAPEEHYHRRDAAAVAAMFDGLRFGR